MSRACASVVAGAGAGPQVMAVHFYPGPEKFQMVQFARKPHPNPGVGLTGQADPTPVFSKVFPYSGARIL